MQTTEIWKWRESVLLSCWISWVSTWLKGWVYTENVSCLQRGAVSCLRFYSYSEPPLSYNRSEANHLQATMECGMKRSWTSGGTRFFFSGRGIEWAKCVWPFFSSDGGGGKWGKSLRLGGICPLDATTVLNLNFFPTRGAARRSWGSVLLSIPIGPMLMLQKHKCACGRTVVSSMNPA